MKKTKEALQEMKDRLADLAIKYATDVELINKYVRVMHAVIIAEERINHLENGTAHRYYTEAQP